MAKEKMIKVPQSVIEAAFNVVFLAHDTAMDVLAGSDPEVDDMTPDKKVADESKIFLDWYSSDHHAKQL